MYQALAIYHELICALAGDGSHKHEGAAINVVTSSLGTYYYFDLVPNLTCGKTNLHPLAAQLQRDPIVCDILHAYLTLYDNIKMGTMKPQVAHLECDQTLPVGSHIQHLSGQTAMLIFACTEGMNHISFGSSPGCRLTSVSHSESGGTFSRYQLT